jgi:hypothetical protein
VAIRIAGPWSLDTVWTYLAEAEIPVQIAVLNNDNLPILISPWFSYDNNHIRYTTQRDAHVVKLLFNLI